jgi:hypothetical protein
MEPAPFRMVDTINPILDLEHDAAVLRHSPRATLPALARLERECPVLEIARVHLEGLLVRVNVETNAGPRRPDAGDGLVGVTPVDGGRAVDDVAVV